MVDLSLLALGAAELDEAVRLSARDPIDATAAAYRALRAFEAAPTRRGQAAAHLMIGELALFSGEPDEALEHLTAGSDLFGAVEDAIGRRAAALGRHQAALALGRLHTRLGDLSAAGIAFHEAADQAEAAEDDSARASAERELGSWARREGRGGEAAAHYRRAFEALTRLGDLAGLAAVHLSLGNLCSAQGAWSDAVTCYAASAKLFRGVDDRLGEANAERFWGQAARGLGQPAQAQRHLARALELYQAVGDKLGQSYSRLALGELASQGAEAPAAREHLAEAVELLARLGESEPLAKAVELLADSFEAEGDRLGALRALTSGLAEARQAGRWETSGARRERAAAARAALESRALELAVELAEPLAAGEAIERGMAGLTGLLPALVTGPPSSDPKTERLRRQIQELAARLRAAANPAPDAEPGAEPGTDPPTGPPPGDDQEKRDGPDTRTAAGAPAASPVASAPEARTTIIAQLEALLGPQAARLAAPAPLDYQAAIEAIRRSGAVAQYSCPGGIVQGETLYVVWAGADEPPGVARTVLTQAAADRLNLLAGTSLLADRESKQDASGLEREAEAARAMGLTPPGRDPGGLERTRRLAKRTGDLWSALDRDPRSDPAALEVAAALFPPKLMAALDRARDPVSGVPGPLLIAPGARLWNLPWAGLVTSGDGRRLIESARVSLTPSLTALSQGESLANGEGGAGVRRVAAWIPTGGGTVRGAEVERAAIGALFGPQALAGEPEAFLSQWQGADAAIASVHGNAEAGLSHGIDLTAERSLTGADLLGLDVPGVLVVGACWSARVEADGEPHALALIAHARGAANVIGGVYPLPDAPPFPTSRLLTHLYAALGRTDPATALWLAQHEAAAAGALPHTWAGVTCTTVGLGGRRRA